LFAIASIRNPIYTSNPDVPPDDHGPAAVVAGASPQLYA